MRLTTLGTGTISLAPGRARAGHLIESGGVRILLDCGSGVTLRLAEHVAAWREITHIAITHFHLDHVADLSTLFFAFRYADRPGRSAPITVLGPVGTRALYQRIADAAGAWMADPGFAVEIIELEPGQRHDLAESLTLEAVKVPHTEESVAYGVSDGHRRIVYSGDCGYDPMFAEWARGADVLLCECSLPAALAIPGHMTPAECGALAAAAMPRHFVLTHFYPPVEAVDILSIVRAFYPGPVSLALDGDQFHVVVSGANQSRVTGVSSARQP